VIHRIVRIVLLTLILVYMYPVMAHCQDTVVPAVIDDKDKIEVIYRLEELKVRREQIKMFEAIIARDSVQDEREKALNEKQVVMLTDERDLYKDKAESYKKALDDMMKGRSVGCWVAKIFTLGLARCR